MSTDLSNSLNRPSRMQVLAFRRATHGSIAVLYFLSAYVGPGPCKTEIN